MSHHDHIVKQFCEPIGEDSEQYRIKQKILDLQQIQDRKKDEYERERALEGKAQWPLILLWTLKE